VNAGPRRTTAAAALSGLAPRLTERDFQIIDALDRFGVMTTTQIGAVWFPSPSAAHLRLGALTGMGVLARTRLDGSGAWRYTLDWIGQAIRALRGDTRPPSRANAEWEVQRKFLSPNRAHDHGTVEAVAALHLACHRSGNARITEWLSETEASHEFQGLRPDAAFTLETSDWRRLTAWYEHDTGTETLARLTAKIDAYHHRRSPLLPYNRKVLIAVSTPARARSLAHLVTDTGDLTVAVGPHPLVPPWRGDWASATHLLTEPHWQVLASRAGPCNLLDLTAPLSDKTVDIRMFLPHQHQPISMGPSASPLQRPHQRP